MKDTMNTYLLIKTLHIISSVLIVGTGFGTAFYLFFANRSGSVEAMSVVSRLVCRADLWFTTPAAVFQPLTGLWLAHTAGFAWTTPWLIVSIGLYVFAGICWVPVLVLQVRMARIASHASASGAMAMPSEYWHYAKRWELLGYPAFIAMIVIYFLMVAKPALG
jgi:uncharacterized membrane protein